jgi:hypothetical protein
MGGIPLRQRSNASSDILRRMHESLRPLLDTFTTLEFEEFGWVALTGVMWEGNDLTLHLVVHQQDLPDECWRLRCRAERENRILNNKGCDGVVVTTEHPVLLPHTSPVTELYFSGRPADPDAVVGQLMEAHHEFVGRWFDGLRFFNLGPHRSIKRMLEGGFGKLVDGPQPLVERYADVLRRAAISVSSPPPRRPMWWDGENWIGSSGPMYAVVLGESYVVSPDVTAERA